MTYIFNNNIRNNLRIFEHVIGANDFRKAEGKGRLGFKKIFNLIFNPHKEIQELQNRIFSSYFSISPTVSQYILKKQFNETVLRPHNNRWVSKVLFWTQIPEFNQSDLSKVHATLKCRLEESIKKLDPDSIKGQTTAVASSNLQDVRETLIDLNPVILAEDPILSNLWKNLNSQYLNIKKELKIPIKDKPYEDLGCKWLFDAIENYLYYNFNERDLCAFGFVWGKYKPHFNDKSFSYSALFPQRNIKTEEVQKLSIDEILNLESERFFSLIDLFSVKQCMELLNSDALHRKIAIVLMRKDIPSIFAEEMNKIFDEPIPQDLLDNADKLWKGLKKYNASEFSDLTKSKTWKEIDAARKTGSATLNGENGTPWQTLEDNGWEKANEEFLFRVAHQNTFDVEFLKKLNKTLRPGERDLGGINQNAGEIREVVGFEVLSAKIVLLPTKCVKEELDKFLVWLNVQIKLCDEGKANPIAVAASAYQRLVSIHPFDNGNGRTSRILADIILRRYGLLPATWAYKDVNTAVLPYLDKNNRATPAKALENLMKGLENTYNIANNHLKAVIT